MLFFNLSILRLYVGLVYGHKDEEKTITLNTIRLVCVFHKNTNNRELCRMMLRVVNPLDTSLLLIIYKFLSEFV